MTSLQHLQAVTLVDVHCHADTLAAALPRVPLDRLALEWCHALFKGQHADERAIWLQEDEGGWVQGLYSVMLCTGVPVAVAA